MATQTDADKLCIVLDALTVIADGVANFTAIQQEKEARQLKLLLGLVLGREPTPAEISAVTPW